MTKNIKKFDSRDNPVLYRRIEETLFELAKQTKSEPSLVFLRQFQALHPESVVYLVGGIVRDCVLDYYCKDFDFVIAGVEQEKLEEYLIDNGKIIAESDRATGIYRFIPTGGREIYDIALTRIENYEVKSRKPRVKTNVSIEEDLARRDFTINAMAVAPFKKHIQLIDLFGGIEDLGKGLIRAVGEPKQRFFEDPLRMLRAVRLACRFGFEIEESTLQAIQEMASEINNENIDDDNRKIRKVSYERISAEIIAALEADPVTFFDLMEESGLMSEVLPEVKSMRGVEQPPEFHSEGDVWQHTRLVLRSLPPSATLAVKLAALLHDIGKSETFKSAAETGDRIRFSGHQKVSLEMTKEILKRFKLKKEIREEVEWLISKHMLLLGDFTKMRLSRQKELVKNPYFDDLVILTRADAEGSIPRGGGFSESAISKIDEVKAIVKAEAAAKKPLTILNGHQLREILKQEWIKFDFKKQAPLIGEILKEVNEAYQDGEIRTEKEAAQKAIALINKFKNS